MKRLKGFDALMYYSENQIAPQHVLGMLILDPSTCPGGKLHRESLEALVLSRLDQLDIFRKKIVKAPADIAFPALVDDPNFRLQNHFKHIALPQPGNHQQLEDIVSNIASTPLDMRRPLWEMTLIDGFENGRYSVLVTKTHHCLMDGVGGAQMMPKLLDTKPVKPPRLDSLKNKWTADSPSSVELLWSDLKDLPGNYIELTTTLGKLGKQLGSKSIHAAGKQVGSLASSIRGKNSRTKTSVLQRETPDSVPRLYFNRALTPARNVAFGNLPMQGIKEIRHTLDLTFNDVVLGICTLALRDFLKAHKALPAGNIVATMPISTRGELGSEGMNQLKIVQTPLPTRIKDTVAVLKSTGAIMDDIKALHAASSGSNVKLSKLVTPRLGALVGTLYGIEGLTDYVRFLKSNLALSTIAGPSMPLYMGEAKLVSICPVGPLADGVGLTVSVMTYEGKANFTITACPDHLPDVQSLADHILKAYEEALQAVRKLNKPKPKSKAKKAQKKVTGQRKVAATSGKPQGLKQRRQQNTELNSPVL